MKTIDKLSFVTIKDRKVLFVLEKNNTIWYTPGGKREEGELDHETLLRETKEELNIDLVPESISHIHTITVESVDKPDVMVNLICYTAEYSGEINPQNEIEKVAYLTHSDTHLVAQGGNLLLQYLKQNNLID